MRIWAGVLVGGVVAFIFGFHNLAVGRALNARHRKEGAVDFERLDVSVAGTGVVKGDGEAVQKAAVGQPFNLLYQIDGDSTGDNTGYSVSSAGDVDGDGKADFIIGSPFASATPAADTSLHYVDCGKINIYSGATGTGIIGWLDPQNGGGLGYSVAGIGDINGDGKSEYIAGAPFHDAFSIYTDAGKIFVYPGDTSGFPFTSPIYNIVGHSQFDNFGWSVAGCGDVNGDGTPDFIVGAPGVDSGGQFDFGAAYVYSGTGGTPELGNLLYEKDGGAAGDLLGYSVAGAGDVNGDGKADFIIGAMTADPGGRADAGSAYVYSGFDGSLLYQKDGAAAGDNLGFSVGGAGDVNGDGKADFIIGARFADPGGRSQAGSVYVYSGADGSVLYQKDGSVSGDVLGYSVAGAGDVNGDGRPDFIIGARLANPGGRTDAGSAYLYSGATGALLLQKDGAVANDRLGHSVASAGDVNGDGRPEIIIGAIATDPGGRTDAGSAFVYGIVVTHKPHWEPISNQSVNANQLLTFGFSASDSDGTIPSLSSATPLPSGTVFIDSLNGAGSISWTPTCCQIGNYAVSLLASDGSLADTCNFTISVAANVMKGDLNGDSALAPSDAVLELNCVFLGTGNCELCLTDMNCDCALSPADVVAELNMVYLAAPPPC